ncbi:MAG: hypothetical protein KME03_18155 [Aphanocapsa lilacina HA4352-LM1]|jgi:hypothetical protein|nr:hypothetical protein [Aphanocapsa lilacina HA4352-LM1]
MTSHCRHRLYALQILGAAVGIAIPLLSCLTMVYAATTGQMPFYATGAVPLVLLALAAALGSWIWMQSAELA